MKASDKRCGIGTSSVVRTGQYLVKNSKYNIESQHTYYTKSSLWHNSRVTTLHTAVSGSIPGSVGIFNKDFLPETKRDDGAEPQSLVLFQIYLG